MLLIVKYFGTKGQGYIPPLPKAKGEGHIAISGIVELQSLPTQPQSLHPRRKRMTFGRYRGHGESNPIVVPGGGKSRDERVYPGTVGSPFLSAIQRSTKEERTKALSVPCKSSCLQTVDYSKAWRFIFLLFFCLLKAGNLELQCSKESCQTHPATKAEQQSQRKPGQAPLLWDCKPGRPCLWRGVPVSQKTGLPHF